jgi:uncharacterized phage infection (PIP) family protein YhgE
MTSEDRDKIFQDKYVETLDSGDVSMKDYILYCIDEYYHGVEGIISDDCQKMEKIKDKLEYLNLLNEELNERNSDDWITVYLDNYMNKGYFGRIPGDAIESYIPKINEGYEKFRKELSNELSKVSKMVDSEYSVNELASRKDDIIQALTSLPKYITTSKSDIEQSEDESNETNNMNDIQGLCTKHTPGQIENLFAELKNEGFIATETESKDFQSAFDTSPIPSNFSPIKWNKSETLFTYFIREVADISDNPSLWKVARHCFTRKDGKPFKNLRQAASNYKINYGDKPKYHERIDAVMEKIKEI